MEFEKWFRTFIDEKDLPEVSFDMEIEGELHVIDNYDMVEIIINTMDDEVQAKIKHKLVGIDFLNGDVNHFLKYLAKGYLEHVYKKSGGN